MTSTKKPKITADIPKRSNLSQESSIKALKRLLALEADNVDPSEKRYARMKVFEALQKALDSITAALGTNQTGKLDAVLHVVMNEPDEGANL